MSRYRKAGIASGAKAEDAEWFASDIKPAIPADSSVAHKMILSVIPSAATDIEITFDSGDTWKTLELEASVVANKLQNFEFYCHEGDLINLRAGSTGGATLTHCVIAEELS